MSTFSVTIPNDALIGIAQLVHFIPVRKFDRDMAPILTTVHITIEPDFTAEGEPLWALVAVATDRYMVGRYVTTFTGEVGGIEANENIDPADGVSFLLSADLLKSIKPTVRESANWNIHVDERRPEHYTAQYGESTVTFNNGDRSLSGLVIGGNYPPVARLIPTDDNVSDLAPTYHLNMANVARIGKVTLPGDDNTGSWILRGTEPERLSSKPGPIVWDRTWGSHRMTVLQQPNMPLR